MAYKNVKERGVKKDVERCFNFFDFDSGFNDFKYRRR